MTTFSRGEALQRPGGGNRWSGAVWTGIALALLAGWPSGCGGPAAPSGPYNILLISIDTLRSDHLGCYGYERETSPNIDALAADGVLFENAISACCWTLPSHVTMLTGLYPSFHGVQDEGVQLGESVPTLAEALGQKGYRTLAVVSHVYVSSRFGLDKGFETFDGTLLKGAKTEPPAEKVIDRALELLESEDTRPYFAFVHLYDPHWDYAPPAPFDTRFTDPHYSGSIDGTLHSMIRYVGGPDQMPRRELEHIIALYDGEIAYVDQQIDRLLDSLREAGRLQDTLVIITSDHGEEFQEHRRLGHQKSLFGEVVQVPLIVAGDHPALQKATRRTDLVSLVDLAPTILEIAGAGSIPRSPGRPLLTERSPADRNVFAESVRYGFEMRAVRDLRFKLIHYREGDRKHFYDLDRDPHEMMLMLQDPSQGKLSSALNEYAMYADEGWHLKFINLAPEPMTCRVHLRTEGRIVQPQRYFTRMVGDPDKVQFGDWEVEPEPGVLRFEVALTGVMGEIAFKTDPVDAPVTFQIMVQNESGNAQVFLGAVDAIPQGQTIRLLPDDPRLEALPPRYRQATPGCYVWTASPQAERGEDAELTTEEIERLRALGY